MPCTEVLVTNHSSDTFLCVRFLKVYSIIFASDIRWKGSFLQYDQPNANCQLYLIWDFYLNDPSFLFLTAYSCLLLLYAAERPTL